MKKLYWLFRKTVLIDYSYKFRNILKFANIFFSIVVFFYIGSLVNHTAIPALNIYGGEYFSFVLFGLAVNSYFRTARSSFTNNLSNEQVLGTLEAVVATGTNFTLVLLGLSLYDFLYLTIQVCAMFLLGVVLFGTKIVWAKLVLGVSLLILSILAFAGFGLISAAFVMVFKRGDPVAWLLGNLSLVLSGVYYPIESLPQWLQKLSVFLPLTHSLKAIRLVLLKGASIAEVRNEIYALCLFAMILLPFSIFCLKYALNKVTFDGTLPAH